MGGAKGWKRTIKWKVKGMGESIGAGPSVIQRSMVAQRDLISPTQLREDEEAVLTIENGEVCVDLRALANLRTKKGIEH